MSENTVMGHDDRYVPLIENEDEVGAQSHHDSMSEAPAEREGADIRTNTRDGVLRDLADILRGIISPAVAAPPVAQPSARNVNHLARKSGATDFYGVKNDDPCAAENWLIKLTRVFNDLLFTPEEKYRCAVSLLQGEAYKWWQSENAAAHPDRATWEYLERVFKGRFIGREYIQARRREFVNLVQGSMTADQYEKEFMRLSYYAPEMIANDEHKCERFLGGLDPDLHTAVIGFQDTSYAALHKRAISIDSSRRRAAEHHKTENAAKRPFSSNDSQGFSKRQRSFQNRGKSSFRSPQPSKSNFRPQPPASVVSTGGSARPDSIPICDHCKRRHPGECWKHWELVLNVALRNISFETVR